MWTPYEIGIVLHHYISPAPFDRASAPAYWPTVDRLIDLGILRGGKDSPPIVTDLGKGLVELWLKTPVPVIQYADPRFAERRLKEAMQELAG